MSIDKINANLYDIDLIKILVSLDKEALKLFEKEFFRAIGTIINEEENIESQIQRWIDVDKKHIDEVFIKAGITPKKTINIHTSEGILTGVRNNCGIGYIISDIIKNSDEFRVIEVKEKLHEESIIILYNKKFLTTAPIRFIEENLNIDIK